jgi:hypothetical protein
LASLLVRKGFEMLRSATKEERLTLPRHSTWGRTYIQALAERIIVQGQPPPVDREMEIIRERMRHSNNV